MKRTYYDEPLDAELTRWPGVSARRERAKKHHRLVLCFGGRSRFLVYPGTPGDLRGVLNTLSAMRRTLRQLGAVRTGAAR